ncbi:hypothetical protein [Bradyrhizobium sp. CIR48]|uniref:hypothetical protein n=1 Tax=unclassified Bradyrhizobium TaxID=2631580 RepID=UPI0039089D64
MAQSNAHGSYGDFSIDATDRLLQRDSCCRHIILEAQNNKIIPLVTRTIPVNLCRPLAGALRGVRLRSLPSSSYFDVFAGLWILTVACFARD